MGTTHEMDRQQRTRYKGHISLCEIDLPGQQTLMNGRVLIIGAGGLGSPVGLYLAAAGVGTIGVMDADNVSLSNLQRQIMHGTGDIGRPKVESAHDAMMRINPEVNLELHPYFLTSENAEEIIGSYDITVDCTDNLATRLLINDTCVKIGKPYVYGAVSRFSGQLFTYQPGSANYRDIFDTTVRPDELPCAVEGVMNTVVGVIGTLQATETVKWLVKTGDLLTNRLLVFDAITMTFNEFEINPIGA
jgi:adenylyltransferase/sulfurtransferase